MPLAAVAESVILPPATITTLVPGEVSENPFRLTLPTAVAVRAVGAIIVPPSPKVRLAALFSTSAPPVWVWSVPELSIVLASR